MKSPCHLYRIKVATDCEKDYLLLTLSVWLLRYKQNNYMYVYTSGNIQLPKGTKKYMYRLSNMLFPIPIKEENSTKELFYTSDYPVTRVGGFA